MAYSPSIFFLLTTKILLILFFTQTLVKADFNATPSKNTTLQLFLHEYLKPPNVTFIVVTSGQTNSTFNFGELFVFDDKITSDIDPDMPEVGRAQGIAVFASTSAFDVHFSATLVFSKGEWNGSSLSLLGVIKASAKVNELAIVGGTRIFQFSQGYAKYSFVSTNSTSGVSTGSLNVFVRNN